MARVSLPSPLPADRRGLHHGRPYELWLPASPPPWPAMVILHGAGSCKENHGDFARACRSSGWAAHRLRPARTRRIGGRDVPGRRRRRGRDGASARVSRWRRSLPGLRPGFEHGRLHGDSRRRDQPGPQRRDRDLPRRRGAPAPRTAHRESSRCGSMPIALDAWLGEHDLRSAVEALGSKPLLLLHAGRRRGDSQRLVAGALRAQGRAAQADHPARRSPSIAPARPGAAGGIAAVAGKGVRAWG